jgi:glycosyltransferase involved in cell wall biosynthesis
MDDKKKILVIGPSPTRSKGGMATVIEEIEKDTELNEKFDIDIYESYIDGNKVVRFFFSIYAFVKFFLTKRNYDLYHVHVASRGSTFRKGHYVDVIKKWNKKVILHIHGAQYLVFYDEITKKKQKRVVEILKKSNMVIALSQDWKDKFDKRFGLSNCCVLENGIDMDRLAPAICEPALHQNAFVTLGRLGQRKGTYDLIDAIDIARKTVPSIKCYFAGDGDVEKVRNLVKTRSLEKNIEVVGWADFDKKLELLSSASTVVLPSYNEGLPMSILEGMACGKAIISTTVGAIPEVIDEKNGILITPGDVKALAEALLKCSSDINTLRCMSVLNIRRIENEFSMKIMHEKLLAYYSRLLNNASSAI